MSLGHGQLTAAFSSATVLLLTWLYLQISTRLTLIIRWQKLWIKAKIDGYKKTGYKNLKLKCTLRAPITVYWVSCIRDEIYIWSRIGDQTKKGKLGKLGTLTSQSPPTPGSSRPSAWSSTWSSHWNRQSNQKKGELATLWSQSGICDAHWPSGLNRPHSFLSWVFPLENMTIGHWWVQNG